MESFRMKMLEVDLNEGRAEEKSISPDLIRKFLGGRGLGVRLFVESINPNVDALSDKNPILFSTSPLTGLPAPSMVKCSAVTKSPLTGTILMTLVGGYFGTGLRKAGYDVVKITGEAGESKILQIKNGSSSLREAKEYKGMSTSNTQKYMKKRFGEEVEIACIGPAAEKGVKFSSIIHDDYVFGRGGAGTVMGSKNLKAIAVSGDRNLPILLKEEFDVARRNIIKKYSKSKSLDKFSKYGTAGVVNAVQERGILPTRNYQEGVFECADKINGDYLVYNYVKDKETCFGCPVACSSISVVEKGRYSGTVTKGPEYESIIMLGPVCGVKEMDAIIAANQKCAELGMDTISTGNTISFLMEAYERGELGEETLEKIEREPVFGNERAMMELIGLIGNRIGIGEILGEGVKKAAEELGFPKLAMHVKGLELPGYDPRGAKGMGLGYATSPRGGCHERGLITEEVFGKPEPVDRFSTEGKGELVKETQDEMTILDSLGMCVFPLHNSKVSISDLAKLFEATTGLETEVSDLWLAGERAWNLERIFNIKAGFTSEHDVIPSRFLKEPLQKGPSEGSTVELDKLLKDYYRERGWNDRGEPEKEKLEELGIVAFFNF
ncbi:hypothetical protein AKJ61_03100 [candidate division MSBL1 archaeon SCGC-AAA259B11]|uniref:Aldehyde ferredoxin oxidoreductase N-terminal domain-containing protein n=1 Tax=candidate division MSBL1 archaeon SCGC-AAA259B11 TaxID=1698260 RepID=A0A133U572_9EURY|nr:hypothetical protein AKJ61_03100 [candidate division MSBL1 archaeon SCGC-AAA259B11]